MFNVLALHLPGAGGDPCIKIEMFYTIVFWFSRRWILVKAELTAVKWIYVEMHERERSMYFMLIYAGCDDLIA